MGNEQSQVSGGQSRFGFRVLRSTKDEIPLEPWFDYICGINGREIDDADPRLFQEEIRNSAGGAVNLTVWSAKGQTLRDVIVKIPPGDDPSPLGISLRWSGLATAEDVWHVLDISPNSPAEMAALLPYSDYIIGTPHGIVRGESGLGDLVEDHIDRPLQLFVYNHELNLVREVTILPRKHWGGDGTLGCVLGYGALHRLPPPVSEPLSQPGEALFEYPHSDTGEPAPEPNPPDDGAGFITPAFALQNQPGSPAPTQFLSPMVDSMTRSPPPSTPTPPTMMDPTALQAGQQAASAPPPPPMMMSPYDQGSTGSTPAARRGKTRNARNNRLNMMDAYMQEEETKSKQDDYVTDSAAKSTPPPPGGARPPPPQKK
ncbi:hypothetical protein H072_1777 [Dactylellina haptotyla CBS 200.50]|uniref:PDZ GRASP-type domain-containing protein n=1 Tax=Dactylellina haptotyla (strain CBS 200.50) TaxID=1284197 RepID=S8AMQ8_DACHA|nr:hypothetical protein H072_1777 [Dactylellina haptotyla CBS 200.50]